MKCDECYFNASIILLDFCFIAQLLCLFLLLHFSEACVDVEPSLIPTVYTIIVCIDYILAVVYTVLPDELQCTYALIWFSYFRNQECLQERISNNRQFEL